ncbi:MAG: hypothetical protein SWH61_01675 [Thermodesulfobacteriota bacterium]|nr:hypothetical protein [Thermodesulfobacteriota bacterium]
MYQTHLAQYRMRADTRFIRSFEELIALYGRCREARDAENPYTLGQIRIQDNQVRIPLLRNSTPFKVFSLSLPVSFQDQLQAMQHLLESMGAQNTVKELSAEQEERDAKLKRVTASFYELDPHRIIKGMMVLEDLRKQHGPDAALMLAAARGYVLMLFDLSFDHMRYSDQFAAKALAFLAFGRTLDPALATEEVSALLAMNMGYTASALKSILPLADSGNIRANVIDAYLRKDLEKLETMTRDEKSIFGDYLLTRLYRENGLRHASKKVIDGLLEHYPDNYPVMAEAIEAMDLSVEKKLTVVYPVRILIEVAEKVLPDFEKEKEKQIEGWRLGFLGDEKGDDISFARFDLMLAKWRFLPDSTSYGFFINNKTCRDIYRTLYTEAVYSRFNLLFNRWSVVERAQDFVQILARGNRLHPMVMLMSGEVKARTGKQQAAEEIFARLIKHPGVTPELAIAAHQAISDYSQAEIRMLPLVAGCLDGRPGDLARNGRLLYQHMHCDLAAKYYKLRLQNDPYAFHDYGMLAWITGDDTLLKSALKQFPDQINLLKAAGDYYASRKDPAFMNQALKWRREANELVPASAASAGGLADMLEHMGRHEEAIEVLHNWIDNFGDDSLTTTVKWGRIAKIYLDMDKPLPAIGILIDNGDTHALVDFYLQGDRRRAAALVVKRKIRIYSDAAKFLKEENPHEALKILAEHQYEDISDLVIQLVEADTPYLDLDFESRDRYGLKNLFDTIQQKGQAFTRNLIRQAIKGKVQEISRNRLDHLVLDCLGAADAAYALQVLQMTIASYRHALAAMNNQNNNAALRYLSKGIDDYQSSIIVQTARAYEALNRTALAEEVFQKGMARYPTSGYMFSKAAAFRWRRGENDAAATLIARGMRIQGKYSRWFVEDFMKVFLRAPDPSVINAVDALIQKGVDRWTISIMGYRYMQNDRPETAYHLISRIPASSSMGMLEKYADSYIFLKAWKGKEEARQIVLTHIKGDTRSVFAVLLFQKGLYDLALELLDKPDSFTRHREFVWLQRLMAWCAMEKKPASIAGEFNRHYQAPASGYYHSVGRFMMGELTRDDLLKQIKTLKQRCEFAYYIGFSERMQGNFEEAVNWYQVCLATLLENNGEYHWAFDELYWWRLVGTCHRHRSSLDDRQTYYQRQNMGQQSFL